MREEFAALEPSPPPPGLEPDLRVGFILSPKFSLLPFACFIDCLRHAADEADRSRQIYCRWSVVAPSLQPIQASCGVEITPQEAFPEPTCFDYIAVVGGLLPWALDHPPETYRYLRYVNNRHVPIIGLCTGSFILAAAGLMDGLRCAVHFEHARQLRQLFPKVIPVTDEVYVMDHGMITCPGGTAAIDLSAALITQHCGKARAIKGLLSLSVDNRFARNVPHRPYENLLECGDWRVERAVHLMQANLNRPFGIEELAKRAGSTLRELDRAFVRHVGEKPMGLWRKMRLSHGHWLLINTNRTITQIAHECGFADTAHFSRWFKRTYGEPPHAFRVRRHDLVRPRDPMQPGVRHDAPESDAVATDRQHADA
jgi:transcriptional regulator GlxA family with amidase domain